MEPRREQDQDRAPAAAEASEPTPAPVDADPERGETGNADLLSLALVVFFVALIGVVGALLLMPVIF